MYEAGLRHTRTAAQRADVLLDWQRDDRAFFAAGACHILAHQFISLHPGEGYQPVYIRPHATMTGAHVYTTNGHWAFDFNGWTPEAELLAVHAAAYRAVDPAWDYDRIVLTDGLPEFLKHTNDLRPPDYFPELPWRRAHAYIHQFAPQPPNDDHPEPPPDAPADDTPITTSRRTFVIVSGPPGSGKTTLAAALSAELRLPLLSKDTLKEAMMRVIEVPDVATSQRIGAAAIEALFALAADSHGAVLESVWRPHLARPQLEALDGHKVEVFCDCPADLARRRYQQRAATRPGGHFDHLRAATDELWTGDAAQPINGPWPMLRVDTRATVEARALAGRVMAVSTANS